MCIFVGRTRRDGAPRSVTPYHAPSHRTASCYDVPLGSHAQTHFFVFFGLGGVVWSRWNALRSALETGSP